jgi:hypothetical protein
MIGKNLFRFVFTKLVVYFDEEISDSRLRCGRYSRTEI